MTVHVVNIRGVLVVMLETIMVVRM